MRTNESYFYGAHGKCARVAVQVGITNTDTAQAARREAHRCAECEEYFDSRAELDEHTRTNGAFIQ